MKYWIIERYVENEYQDCFDDGALVGCKGSGLHRAPAGAPSPSPKWGTLFDDEGRAASVADELTRKIGVGSKAAPGRYSVAEFRPNSIASDAI